MNLNCSALGVARLGGGNRVQSGNTASEVCAVVTVGSNTGTSFCHLKQEM